MRRVMLVIVACVPGLVAAAAICDGKSATAVNGTVVSTPYFQVGKDYAGVPLSHTIFYIKTADQQLMQVAVDNVFAVDYDQSHGDAIPLSFSAVLKPGTEVQLCGETYTDRGIGIHWVHTNCGDNNTGPTGFVMVNGTSLTNNQEYCSLWAR